MKIISTAVLFYALTTGVAPAAFTTFDDLPTAGIGGSIIPNGYAGLTWSNMFYVNSFNNNFGSGSGYSRGVVSSPNVSFMGDDSIGRFVLVSGPKFDFNSAYLTAAWRNGLNIRVRGFTGGLNGTLRYDTTVIANQSGPTLFNFNYLGIDTLRFDTSGGTPGPLGDGGRHFAMDNMNFRFVGEPTAQDLTLVVPSNLNTPLGLTGSDPNGRPLTFNLVTHPAHGDIFSQGSGTSQTFSYLSFLNYLGQDSFKYVANNGSFNSSVATVRLTVKHGLSINNISLTEGNSGTKAFTFTVTMTAPANEFDVVSVGYRTADGSARAGSDYVAKSGSLFFASANLSQPVTVSVIGDTLNEFNETFLVSLTNASSNAVIVNGIGRGTIVNDDGSRIVIGTAALTPENSVVRVGEPVNLSLTWTHPVGWRQLDSVDLLLLDDEGEILARWHEAENSFSLFNSAAGRFVRTAAAGSPRRFETSAATLQLQDSTGGGPPGQTVTIDFSLSFKPRAGGRTFSMEALATDDAGNQHGFESVGTLTVLPHSHND